MHIVVLMAPKISSREKGKRRINKTYDSTLFDSFEHIKRFSKFESKIVHKGKYIDLEDVEDLETI